MIRKLAALAALLLILPSALTVANGASVDLQAMNSGKEHLRRDEYEMAVKSFTTYAALAPADKHSYDLRACAYLRMENLDLALKDIARSQQIDANEQTGYFSFWLRGIALLLQEDSAGADSALSTAARGSPSIAGLRIARARQYADSLVGGDGSTEQPGVGCGRKLADLLLDECIDSQLFGEQ